MWTFDLAKRAKFRQVGWHRLFILTVRDLSSKFKAHGCRKSYDNHLNPNAHRDTFVSHNATFHRLREANALCIPISLQTVRMNRIIFNSNHKVNRHCECAPQWLRRIDLFRKGQTFCYGEGFWRIEWRVRFVAFALPCFTASGNTTRRQRTLVKVSHSLSAKKTML